MRPKPSELEKAMMFFLIRVLAQALSPEEKGRQSQIHLAEKIEVLGKELVVLVSSF